MKDKSFTRREALKGIAVASAGVATLGHPALVLAQEAPILVGGRPAEITLTTVSPQTVRVTVQAIEDGGPQPVPQDGALIRPTWGSPIARLRTLSGSRSIKSGNLEVKLSANP